MKALLMNGPVDGREVHTEVEGDPEQLRFKYHMDEMAFEQLPPGVIDATGAEYHHDSCTYVWTYRFAFLLPNGVPVLDCR